MAKNLNNSNDTVAVGMAPRCVRLTVTMGLILPSGFRPHVTYVYAEKGHEHAKADRKELANITPKNCMKVGAAIGRRRLASENEVVGYPISIIAEFADGSVC